MLKATAGQGQGQGQGQAAGVKGGLLGLGLGLGRSSKAALSAPLKEDFAAADFADLEVITEKTDKGDGGDGQGDKPRGISGMFASFTRSKGSKYNG